MAASNVVKPLKLENNADGTAFDPYPTETNPNEDMLAALGLLFKGLQDIYVRTDGNTLLFKDLENIEVSLKELRQGNFSFRNVTSIITVPFDQQMLAYQEVLVMDELEVLGEVIILD